MGKLKKIKALFKTNPVSDKGNGLYASLDELMDMRKYVRLMQTKRKLKSYSQQAGDIKSAFKGRGIEMEEIREYAFGDDIRDIDWRVTARKETPYTKIYAEERDHEILVWLDLSPIMAFGSTIELKSVTAAKTAALLGWLSLNNADRFGCLIFDGKNNWLYKAKNDRAYLAAILKKIADVSKQSLRNTEISAEDKMRSLKLLQANIKGKASVFVISSFSEWNDEYDATLAAIAKKSRMFLTNIYDKLEVQAPKSGQYMAEFAGEKLVLDSNDKKYRKAYADYFAFKKLQREKFCRAFNCKLVDITQESNVVGALKLL